MNADEFNEKLDAILEFAKRTHGESIDLREKVESLQRTVDDLRERMTYRERVLVGWEEIAAYMGFGATTYARKLAKDNVDPLPVMRQGSGVVALATALDAYKERRKFHKRVVARFVISESSEPAS